MLACKICTKILTGMICNIMLAGIILYNVMLENINKKKIWLI